MVSLNRQSNGVYGEAPVGWYSTPGQAHAEAQRQDLNYCMGKASTDMSLTSLDKRRKVQSNRRVTSLSNVLTAENCRRAAPAAGLDCKEQAKKRQKREGGIDSEDAQGLWDLLQMQKGTRMASECPWASLPLRTLRSHTRSFLHLKQIPESLSTFRIKSSSLFCRLFACSLQSKPAAGAAQLQFSAVKVENALGCYRASEVRWSMT